MMPQKTLMDNARGGELVEYRPTPLAVPMAPSLVPSAGPSDSLVRALWRRRWTILATTLLSLAGAFAYLDRAPKIYTSTARIFLGQKPQVVSLGIAAMPGTGDPNFTQVEIIKSTPVLSDAAQKLGFTDSKSTDEEIAHAAESIRDDLSIDVGRRDNIINVNFDSPDRQKAALVVNAVVQAYKSFTISKRLSSANEVLEILRQKATEQEVLRKRQFQALLEFKTANPEYMIVTGAAGGGMATEIQRFRDQISTAQLALIDAESNYEAAHSAGNNPAKLRQMAGPTVVTSLDPEGVEIRKQLSDVGLRLSVLRQRYPKGSPVLGGDETLEAELQARIASSDQKFAEAYTGALYQELLKSQQKLQELQKLLGEEMGQFQVLNSKGAQYEKLSGELQQTDKLLADLGDQIKRLDLAGQTDTPDVQVVERGKVEDSPSRPARTRIMGIALAAGLLLGCLVALTRERLDQRIHSVEEVVGLVGVPVIGVIPHMKRSLTPVARAQSVHWDPMSDVAEAYRAVRTAVNFGVPAGQSKTIVITSPTPGDGKSTSASNIAIAMAQAGKRVLLLDADFRRPVQHKLFEVSQEVGVTSVLAGRDALAKAIQKTATEGLDVLPSGPIPLNPSELLNGESFAEILDELAASYDHIILDCPPVVSVSDARILGAVCDVTILVLRANKVTRKNVEYARASLAGVGARVLGCVVNDVTSANASDGYYGGYGYGYAPVEPVVRRREDVEPTPANGHRRLPSPGEADLRG